MSSRGPRVGFCGMTLAALAALTVTADVKPLVVEGAPFELTVQEWTPPVRAFRITDFGAKPEKADGARRRPYRLGDNPVRYRAEEAVTEAVEAAIEAAAKAGGGRVVVPAGRWLCGAFRLKSNVALVLEKGAELHFPDDPSGYGDDDA